MSAGYWRWTVVAVEQLQATTTPLWVELLQSSLSLSVCMWWDILRWAIYTSAPVVRFLVAAAAVAAAAAIKTRAHVRHNRIGNKNDVFCCNVVHATAAVISNFFAHSWKLEWNLLGICIAGLFGIKRQQNSITGDRDRRLRLLFITEQNADLVA